MDKLPGTYDLPKLNQEYTSHFNSSITSYETKSVTTDILIRRRPGLEGCAAEFYQAVKEELTPVLPKLFHKTEKEERNSTKLIL
jgi:hypothetical protein